jgi:hypothetical protein
MNLTALYQFVNVAKDQCEVLKGMHKKMTSLYQQTAKYFCFDAKKYGIEEFFGDIKAFLDAFTVSSLFILLPSIYVTVPLSILST